MEVSRLLKLLAYYRMYGDNCVENALGDDLDMCHPPDGLAVDHQLQGSASVSFTVSLKLCLAMRATQH